MEENLDPEVLLSSATSDVLVLVYVAFCVLLTAGCFLLFWNVYKRDCRQFWHHAVRLPSRMRQPYWYMISISTGCRPWAGHEGDIFVRLVGSRADSRTFIVNGEVHSRLWEADSHLYLYSSSWPLGEINYIIIACRSAKRKKRWYLSSVQVKFVTTDTEKEKEWYFPYHEWIEIFHEPVKVTLCSVNIDHDINRRLMLGWLGRCLTDFHLWTSVCTSLKYTRFRRNERVACISAQFVGSLMYIVVINGMIPQLGAIVLGLFGASCAIIPVTTMEAILRRIEWKHKILMEDVKWYKDAEDGFGSLTSRPKTYRQYILKPTHKKMNYSLMFQDEDEEPGRRKGKKLNDIFENEGQFWNWLDPAIDLPPVIDDGPVDNCDVEVESKKSQEQEEEDEEYTEEEDEGSWADKLKKKMKKVLPWKSEEDTEASESEKKDVENIPGDPQIDQQERMIQEVVAETVHGTRVLGSDSGAEMFADDIEGSENGDGDKKKEETLLSVGEGFLVQPISVWQVDSDFSIDSLDLKEADFTEFTAMESMPAAEFEGFKKRKVPTNKTAEFTSSEMQIRNMMNPNRRGAIAAIGDTLSEVEDRWGEDGDDNKDEITVPKKINLLTAEENELVSWIYYDRCIHGNMWLKRDVPLASVLLTTEDSGGIQNVDWWGVDVSSDGEGPDEKIRKYADAFRSNEYYRKQEAIRELRRLYPEPVPRERVFSMLMYPDYVAKLGQAYDQMIVHPECWSALADFYAEWADSDDGPQLFSEVCINLSKLANGGKIVHDIISCARTSIAWTSLVCELTQRLRYQGDNVERLKEKYGLGNECLINALEKSHPNSDCSVKIDPGVLKMPQSAFNINNTASGRSMFEFELEEKPSLECVYTELQRLAEWRKKLSEMEITLKRCPMNEVKSEEARKMSRFYRRMIISPGGCALFGELMRQVTMSNNKGRLMVSRIIRYVAGHSDGIPPLNQLLKGLGLTGVSGRRILVRVFKLLDSRKPSGPRVLSNLADALVSVEMGALVLKDLQVDAARAHRRAHEVRQNIRRRFDPIIRTNRRNVCKLVASLNEIAKFMLGVANNSRSVLEGSDLDEGPLRERDIRDIARNEGIATIDDPRAVNDSFWDSERNCCKNYRELQQRINQDAEQKKKKQKEPEYFQLTDSSSEVPFVMRQPAKIDPPLVSELWQPIDGRGDVINIYKNKDDKTDDIIIKSESDEGFSSPCKPKKHCEKQKRMNLNEFFLQSKDYERFNMNFRYKPSIMRDPTSAIQHDSFDFDHEISRCWKPPISTTRRDAYAAPQNLPTDPEQACVKWGREYNPESADSWGGVAMCKCHDKNSTTRDGKHHCVICSIADKLKIADNPGQVVDILTEECKTYPEIAVKELQNLPVIERETIKKIQEILQTKIDSKSTNGTDVPKPSGGSRVEEDNYQDQVIENKKLGSKSAPMPSGQYDDDNMPDKMINDKFPFCGTRTEQVCQCVGGNKRRPNVSLLAKNMAMFGTDKKMSESFICEPDGHKTEANRGCVEGTDKIISPMKVQPDTALRRRREAKDVRFASKSPSEFYQSSQKPIGTITKEYLFPVEEKTSSEKLAMLHRKNDPKYWGRDDSELSLFSHPAVASPSNHCTDCGGLLLPADDADNIQETMYNYLAKRGENMRQGDEITIDSSVHDLENIPNISTGNTTWKQAMGCCNTPGCYARLPRNSRYHYSDGILKEKQMKNYHDRVSELAENIKERYKEWLKDSPCGKPVCTDHKETKTELNLDQCDSELSDISTDKCLDAGLNMVSETTGRILNPTQKFPITAKSKKVEEKRKLLGEVCDLCNFPKFECCDVNDSDDSAKPKNIAGRYCLCRNVNESIDGKYFTVPSAVEKPHSICSECHVRVGTQQRPPCVRYLLPLKIVRCYENILAKYGKAPSESADSGLSLYTALDVLDDDDLLPPHESEQMTLLDLMGLSSRPGTKRRRRRCKPKVSTKSSASSTTLENCSVCSSTTSSGVCCHVHSSRLLPVMHLQGFTCADRDQHSDEKDFPALSFKWWKNHAKSLQSMQACADACVCLCIVLAKDKSEALTDHEKSCKVCSVVGGTPFECQPCDHADGKKLGPRYSEFLPVIWKSEITSLGRLGERSSLVEIRRPRFYKQLVEAIVESTKMLLLTPDLRPQRLTPAISVYDKLFPGATEDPSSPNDDDSEVERAMQGGEEYVTTAHVGRLAHFRALMKCLNDIQHEGSRLRTCKLVGDRDVTRVTVLDQQKHGKREDKEKERKLQEDSENKSDITPESNALSLIDLIINFIKKKACGSVLDCRELLEAPWELPTEQQQIAGRMLKKIDSVLSGMSDSSIKAADKLTNWEDSLGCIVDAYFNEVVFRAVAQTNILKAIRLSNNARKFMLQVADLTRMIIARLVRFSELTQSATSNLKVAIKDELAAVDGKNNGDSFDKVDQKSTSRRSLHKKSSKELDEESKFVKSHIAALLRTGRDDRRATLDDVLISFERLRCDVLDDLREAAGLVKRTSDLGDDRTFWLLNSVNAKNCEKSMTKPEELQCWTESDLDQKDKQITQNSSSDLHINESDNEISIPQWPNLQHLQNLKNNNPSDSGSNEDSRPDLTDTDLQSDETITNPLLLATRAKQWKGKTNPQPSSGILESTSSSNAGLIDLPSIGTQSFATCLTQPANLNKAKMNIIKRAPDLRSASPPPSSSGWMSNFKGKEQQQVMKLNPGTHDVKAARNNLVDEPLMEEVKRTGEEELPHRFQSVFKLTSLTDFKQDKHTRMALEADKGKGMLQCIFGTEMSQVEMVEAFHENIRSLLNWQNSSLPTWVGLVARLILIFITVLSAIGACLLPFILEETNYVLLSAIPVAIFGHGLVLEPLKCLLVTWIMFLSRHKPSFYNNPVYMKSSLHLLKKARLSHPRVSDEFRIIMEDDGPDVKSRDGGDEYYYKFCDNKASTRLFDRRRRTLPVMTEHDLALDLHAVASYGALSGAAPNISTPTPTEPITSIHTSDFLSLASNDLSDLRLSSDDLSDLGGHRRHGVDMGGIKSPKKLPSVTSVGGGFNPSFPRSDTDVNELDVIDNISSSTSSNSGEKIKHTPIIYCRYSNMPSS